MKPTDKQKTIIEYFEDQLSSLRLSNDISSQTHDYESIAILRLDESFQKLLSGEEQKEIFDMMAKLRTFIRSKE